ncbi:MAG: phosphate acyltransferase [Micavibrio sp. TMED27]|nr:phosphate acyltransferase [Micavibrio sp.]OUT89632.1 MAG: phosphate acyltransferase [Micavibrio sp. TMED27]
MTLPITIALDVMGGDHGPDSVLPGAELALARHPGIKFLLFGDEKIINNYLQKKPKLAAVSKVFHAELTIKGDDKPSAALRASKGTSMRLAIEAVKDKKAHVVVSAGNTGALMALAKLILKTVPGIHRPAIASVFPTMDKDTVMLDLGANVLVDSENLVQFAVLGSVFAKSRGVEKPTVGLLNVGSEETKGPDHVKGAAAILSRVEFPGQYYGFVEGDDITKGTVDVVVSDGYAGNIALKSAEGVGKLTSYLFKYYMMRDPIAIIGSLFSFGALKRIKNRIDPRRYNGGVFLGLNGLCIKSHGGCDPLAFSSAVSLASELATNGYVEKVAEDINNLIQQETFLSEETV